MKTPQTIAKSTFSAIFGLNFKFQPSKSLTPYSYRCSNLFVLGQTNFSFFCLSFISIRWVSFETIFDFLSKYFGKDSDENNFDGVPGLFFAVSVDSYFSINEMNLVTPIFFTILTLVRDSDYRYSLVWPSLRAHSFRTKSGFLSQSNENSNFD